jgi:hypothetical protein
LAAVVKVRGAVASAALGLLLQILAVVVAELPA